METSSEIFASFLKAWPRIFTLDFGRYLLGAVLVTLLLGLLDHRTKSRRAVRIRAHASERKRAEFFNSVVAASTFATIGFGVQWGAQNGVFQIYEKIADHGWIYWLGSLAAIVLAHDAYFYWTHRLLHGATLGWSMHRTHHESVAPTQWAAYSFSVGESAIHALFLVCYTLVLPTHVAVIFLWMIHQILRNALGHAGVELEPRSWLAGWWGRWCTTTLHHDLHHAHGRHNYGLYFTWWDRWCGTEHPEYRERLFDLLGRMQTSASGDRADSASLAP